MIFHIEYDYPHLPILWSKRTKIQDFKICFSRSEAGFFFLAQILCLKLHFEKIFENNFLLRIEKRITSI